jgi:hypothetical protein
MLSRQVLFRIGFTSRRRSPAAQDAGWANRVFFTVILQQGERERLLGRYAALTR